MNFFQRPVNFLEPFMRKPYKIGGKYALDQPLGFGCFGIVYLGYDSHKNRVAIKLEDKTNGKKPQLYHEADVYHLLRSCSCVPKLSWFGSEGDFNIMVIAYEHITLKKFYEEERRQLPVSVVTLITIKLLTGLEEIQERGIIHRDIKPNNLCFARHRNDNVMVRFIDFGLSKRYVDDQGNHMPFKDGKRLTGTPRYASLNNHEGVDPTRRDDLESLLYSVISMLLKRLPWELLESKSTRRKRKKAMLKEEQRSLKHKKFKQVYEKKRATSLSQLCDGLPPVYIMALEYTRNLSFSQKPDYPFLLKQFENSLKESKLKVAREAETMIARHADPAELIQEKAKQMDSIREIEKRLQVIPIK